MATKVKPNYDPEKAKTWGSPDFLKMRFDDVSEVQTLSRKCKATKAVKAAVKAASTARDRLAVQAVYRSSGEGPDGPVESVMALLSFGLNGPGVQEDYLLALRRLVKSREFRIFDAFIDACDDLGGVLCTYSPAAAKPSKGGR